MDETVTLLKRVPLFGTLSEARLRPLANSARFCVYPQDTPIVEQGQRIEEAQDGDSLYVIVDGHVRVVLDRSGQEEFLNRLGPGEFFGEMALLDGKPRSATVISEEDTQCLILSRWDLLRAMRRDPEIAIQMLTVMSERLRGMLGAEA
jgi:CRP/FNR family transcriptional regulator, cyclic AMP receptor protein